MDRMGAQASISTVNIARMEYFTACALTASRKFAAARQIFLSLAERLLGIEIEKKS